MRSRMLLLAALGAVVVAIAVAAGLSSPRDVEAATGGLHTTNINCTGTNLNVSYSNKLDVFVEGGPSKVGASALTPGDYGVEVTAPGGNLLGKSAGAVVTVGADGVLPCSRLWDLVLKASDGTQGYDDTTNNGNEYKVQICLDDDFEGSDCKSDNFKVDDEEETPPFDACAPFPNRTIITFGARLGDPSFIPLVGESGAVATSIAAGTYVVTLQSHDGNHPDGLVQNNEQWFARFFDAGGLEDESGVISDLPDAEQTINEIVGQVSFGDEVTSVVARHELFGAFAGNPESIEAVCLALDPVN